MPVAADPQLDAFVAAFDDFARAAKRARGRIAPDETLSPAQYDLLFPLLAGDQAPGLRELARACGVSAPTATRMVDGLEARGLVTRTPCERDRRAVRLALTGEGEAAVVAHRARLLDRRREVFGRLAPDEQRAAAKVLARLAAAYEEVGA